MSPEERQLLTALFDRVNSAASSSPRDPDAETLINQATRNQPASAYYLAQAVIVQEKGLEAADTHIRELESRIRQLEQDANQQVTAPTQGGGFLNSIFGTNQQPQQPRPQFAEQSPGPWGRSPVQPIPQPGPWSSQASSVPQVGGGFLKGALGTAAGVAGGMLLANSLGGIFSNHMAASGLGSMFGSNPAPVEETVINNYYGSDASNGDNGFDQADNDDSDNDIGDNTSDV